MLFKKRKFEKKIIFVIGTGRSGTHLLGRTFDNSPYMTGFIEDKRYFTEITKLATGLNQNKKDLFKILRRYKKDFSKCETEYILEKTHPNIWFVEDILQFFPTSKFIGIKRDAYATIASMLNHRGVMRWYDILPQNKVNHFLGITSDNLSYFKDLPIESKCALRWKSHNSRLEELKEKFPESVLIIDYEDFYVSNEKLISKVKLFLDINFELTIEQLNKDGLEKWKESLNNSEIENINEILNLSIK